MVSWHQFRPPSDGVRPCPLWTLGSGASYCLSRRSLARVPFELEQHLKRYYNHLRLLRQFLKKEVEVNGAPLTPWKWRFLLRGFHSDKRFLYTLGPDALPLPTYLSDFARLRTRRLNGVYRKILDHKWMFKEAVADLIHCPRTVGTVNAEGTIEFAGLGKRTLGRHLLSEVLDALPLPIVAKRFGGGGGKRIFLIDRDPLGFLVNGSPATAAEVAATLRGESFMIEEAIQQGRYAAGLYPHSVNTVRVLTVNDGQSTPWIAFAVQRIGRSISAPTDNFNRGGLCAAIDLETGTLSSALHFSGRSKPVAFDHHPETGAPIRGTVVPDWPVLRAWLLDLVERVPGFSYVGWDVVLLESGFMLLEGNSYSGVQLIQSHSPLLESRRLAAYYLQRGIIGQRQFDRVFSQPSLPLVDRETV
jgi:hypothetical protein